MAQFVEIDIDQGTDFILTLQINNDDGTPKNLTGFDFSSSIKKSYYSTSSAADFSVNSLDAENGTIILELTATQTADIKSGRYLFDIKQTSDQFKVERLAEGIVTIHPQITE